MKPTNPNFCESCAMELATCDCVDPKPVHAEYAARPKDPAALVAECAPYLKDGETPRERMDRDFKDSQALTGLLAKERSRTSVAQEALAECEEYFDNRADADCDQDGFIPNKEMRLLSVVRTALQALENSKARLADAHTNPTDSDLSSLRKGADVAVKPLEWRHDNAHSVIGRYWITYTGGKIGLHLDQRKIGKFADPDEAKAAAQCDFETRIRSALVSGSREDG